METVGRVYPFVKSALNPGNLGQNLLNPNPEGTSESERRNPKPPYRPKPLNPKLDSSEVTRETCSVTPLLGYALLAFRVLVLWFGFREV